LVQSNETPFCLQEQQQAHDLDLFCCWSSD
jgi:hypothetical protein